MKNRILTVLVCLACTSLLSAQEIEPIPAELAQRLAPALVDQAGKGEPVKIKIDADVLKANGFHLPEKMGALLVPQKDLMESEELAAKFKTENGAPLAYLFLYKLVPVVEGQKVDANRLRALTLSSEDGTTRTVHMLTLAVKQLSAEDYRLHAYGVDAKPLVEARFAEGTGQGAQPVAIEIKDPDHSTKQGKLVVTVFGKFQATFTAAYTGE